MNRIHRNGRFRGYEHQITGSVHRIAHFDGYDSIHAAKYRLNEQKKMALQEEGHRM